MNGVFKCVRVVMCGDSWFVWMCLDWGNVWGLGCCVFGLVIGNFVFLWIVLVCGWVWWDILVFFLIGMILFV